MITGIDLNAVTDFTLKADKDNPTIWKIGCLPAYVMASIGQEALKDTGKQIEMAIMLVQMGLKGWENFGDIAFRTEKIKIFGREVDAVPEDLLNRLPMNAIMEISEQIMKVNKLTPEEIKN